MKRLFPFVKIVFYLIALSFLIQKESDLKAKNITERESVVDSHSIRLSAQRALTTNVTPNLRAACVRIEGVSDVYERETTIGAFFFDGEYSDDEGEMVDVAVTEISADFPWTETKDYRDSDTQIYRVDYPQVMPLFDELVYLRYEPGYEMYRNRLPRERFSEVSYVTIRLSLQKALLGRVTPNLREVVVHKDGQKFTVYFYYDNAPTTIELMLEKLIEADLHEDFSAQYDADKAIEVKIVQLPYPQRITGHDGGWGVYARYEKIAST